MGGLARLAAALAEPIPVAEFSYETRAGDVLPIRMICLEDGPWLSAHDLAPAIGKGVSWQRVTCSVGKHSRLELNKALVAGDWTRTRWAPRETVWFVSEDAALHLTFEATVAEAMPFRTWLIREALPTLRRTELPHTIREDLPVKITRAKPAGDADVRRLERAQRVAAARRDKTSVYRLFDCDGRLLYVGISMTLAQRIGQHQDAKPWWGDVHTIQHESFKTRAEALAAEATAIRDEKPAHNIQLAASSG